MAKKGSRKDTDSNGRVRKTFHTKDLRKIQPLKKTQEKLFKYWNDDPESSMFLYGSAGTGKTFSAMYLALRDVLDKGNPYDNLLIVRSTVPARDVGFLPGDLEEKIQVYEEPYIEYRNSYLNMKLSGIIRFAPTAFLRGTTFDNSIIIVDEAQNMTFQELDTIMTRVGRHSKIIFSGDMKQSDLIYKKMDSSGFTDFFSVIKKMEDYFHCIEFSSDDIVRSGIVKDYIKIKERIL